MPPHAPAMLGLLVAVTTLGALHAHSVGRSEVASAECDIQQMQKKCSIQNELLLNAEYNRDVDGVCRFYPKMLMCVAENTKDCLDGYMDSMGYYLHSPYYCTLPSEQILKLQKLVFQSNNSDGSLETTPGSTHNGEKGGAQQEGGGAKTSEGVGQGKGYDVKTDSDSLSPDGESGMGNHGTQEEHKGPSDDKDSGRPLASWSLWAVLLLALTSGRLPWRLIS